VRQKKTLVYTDLEPFQQLSEKDEANPEEQYDRLHQALAGLPADDREVLVLTRFQKMKYQEVAAILGTTESNVKVKVFRALEKLRTSFFQLESNQ
jgi:RNA polymerase sigma-70 factor (ECF subfamily)